LGVMCGVMSMAGAFGQLIFVEKELLCRVMD
jgi:hypothetical protein